MEQHVRKLEAELHNKPLDFKLSVVRRQALTYKSIIKPSLYGEFLLTPRSVEIPNHEQASLEVLVTEHGTSATLGPDHNTASHSNSIFQRTHQQTPERLRIRYAPLVKTLEKICRETISSHNIWDSDDTTLTRQTGGAATVILRPWKLFVTYEKDIRDSVHNIDAFLELARREDVSGGVAETGVVEDREYHSP